MKYPATPSSIFFNFFLIDRRVLCSQPIRDKVPRIRRIFPEHVERSFLDPEYSSTNTPYYIRKAKVRPLKNQLYSPNTPKYVREQMFAQLRTGFRLAVFVVSVDVKQHWTWTCVRAWQLGRVLSKHETIAQLRGGLCRLEWATHS